MKTPQRHLITAALLGGLGLAAIAQTQAPATPPAAPSGPHMMQGERGPMDPARMEQMRARMEERMARRLGALKQQLQITPQQEGAWTAWTSAVKSPRFQRPDRAEFQRLSTPERIDRLRALREQRNAAMDKRLDATKSFYAALTPQQQKVFDTDGLRLVRGGRGGMHGHFGRHQG